MQELQSVKGIALRDGEYIHNEVIMCKKCRTPRMIKTDIEGLPYARCQCECEVKSNKRVKQARMIDSLESSSGLSEKYKEVNFANTNVFNKDFQRVYEKCFNFCQNLDDNLSKGKGIYIYGDVGTGKTHIASCIVNEAIKSYTRASLMTFSDIAKEIKKTFGKTDETQYEYILKLTNIPLLVIDDIGTEIVKRNNEDNWLQEQIFDVIDHRYKNKKSTIFTSNYTFEQLIDERGLMEKTVDRVNEMSKKICYLKGDSYRNQLVGE